MSAPDVPTLVSLLDHPTSVPNLRLYYGVDLPAGEQPAFTGGRFDFLGGGGDRPESQDTMTATDLVAVQLLGVDIPGEAALGLLEGRLGVEIAGYLSQIDPRIELGSDAASELIRPGGAADAAWRLLEARDGIGWVTASKLLARKRPRLVPVYDRVVRCALGAPGHFWEYLHHALRADQGRLRTRLEEVRQQADLPEATSPLRVLDVVLWMRHHRSHLRTGCPGINDQPDGQPARGAGAV
ncbi:MAG TPA: DUF6308 family protein [Mycobacteriales bacterium]|jgi:hypothetical protein